MNELIYKEEEIKMLLDLLPVKTFCELCNIHRSYYYKIKNTTSRYQIYKKFCG